MCDLVHVADGGVAHAPQQSLVTCTISGTSGINRTIVRAAPAVDRDVVRPVHAVVAG